MPSENLSTINPNLILESNQPELQEEMLDSTLFAALTTDAASETDYQAAAPMGVVERKSKVLEMGAKCIKFGMFEQLKGEGRYHGEQLVGFEEKLSSLDNAAYFAPVRHGVPYPLKDLEAFYLQAYNLLQQRRRVLSTWNGRIQELWAWQSLLRRYPDKVTAAHGAEAPQLWHPHIFSAEAGGLAKATWNADPAVHMAAISTLLNSIGTGDVLKIDRIDEVEVAADQLHLTPVRVTIDGEAAELLIWAYPRAARVRIKNIFREFWLKGDVRGPGNRAFKGDKFKYGKFLFVEAEYLPRLKRVDSAIVQLEEAWGFDPSAGERKDQRAATNGITHAILGAKALCFAEPEELQWDFERTDYKAREGIGTYRMMGYVRGNEAFDNSKGITRVLSQGSLLLVEDAAAA